MSTTPCVSLCRRSIKARQESVYRPSAKLANDLFENGGDVVINLHHEAAPAFEDASQITKASAKPILELLSLGFQITWFRESSPNVWLALVKPNRETGEHFGLRQECFVIGNGYATDFHQRTLNLAPPDYLFDRLDSTVRFVTSDAPIAPAFCAAWAQKNRATVVLINSEKCQGDDLQRRDRLYALLSTSLWRRDFFAEAEPVRAPSEFFGRQVIVNELFAKILVGSPVAIFGLRKIGKSSLLGRLEDLLTEDDSSITATAFLIGNTTTLTAGRWWHLAQSLLATWQAKLQRLAGVLESKVHAKAERLNELISKKIFDEQQLANAFEKDIVGLLKSARALKDNARKDQVRLIFLLDECDHLYPHLPTSGYWKSDFFTFWNTLQAIKRRLEKPEELIYVLCGVNPSGVEQGALEGQPNPLYEMQRLYLGPMNRVESNSLLTGIGERMGLIFAEDALEETYTLVGGHPLLLRRLGSAIHDGTPNRSAKLTLSRRDIQNAFAKRKRDLFNQVTWFLEHLARVAPDEERLLRDLAKGGAQAYAEQWGDNEFRETFAYHLERYGLVYFINDLPEISLALIGEALRKPAASEYVEQKRQLKDAIESIETATRVRLRVDLEKDSLPAEAVQTAVNAIPSDAKNRALSRQELIDLGDVAGLGAVLEALNWGDYEILFDKHHDKIEWAGKPLTKSERLALLKTTFKNAHVVRHNNDHALKELIDKIGYSVLNERFSSVREMLSS